MTKALTIGPHGIRSNQLGVLQNIFVCITFHWASTKLAPLKVVLSNIAAFPTETKVVIISNEPEHLRIALGDFEVEVCGGHDNLSHPYQLPWSSRRIMEAAYHGETNHTLFIYMEADLELQWPALQAWAQDEELLAPLGFHRGFVRTEISQWSGEVMAFDQTEHTIVGSEGSPVLATRGVQPSGRPQKGAPANQINHFVQLESAYMAMWLASEQQLAAWTMAPEWAPDLDNFKDRLLREEAAFNLYRTNESSYNRGGQFKNSLLVPYNPHALTIPDIAALNHLSNNYCDSDGRQQAVRVAAHAFCTIALRDVLKQQLEE